MWVTVKGYHRVGRYTAGLPADGRVRCADGTGPEHVMDLLGIPEPLRPDILVFVNGRPFSPGRRLADGDTLVLLEKVAGG